MQYKNPGISHCLSLAPGFFGAALLLWIFAGSALASPDDDGRLRGIHSGVQFLAGEEIEVEATIDGDVFAAAGRIDIDETKAKDMILAAGLITLMEFQAADLLAAGGEVEIEGEVSEDLIAAGGRIRLRADSRIAGYALLAGGEIDLAGSIGGDLKAAGGRIRLSGEIQGNVDLAGGEIILAPGTRIAGHLTYRSNSKADIAADAVVSGGIEQIEVETFDLSIWSWIGLALLVWLIAVLSLTLLAAGLHSFDLGLIRGAERTLRTQPWAALALGFALLVAVPIGGNLLLASIIGLPLAVFILSLYCVLSLIGLVAAAYWAGLQALRFLGRSLDEGRLFGRTLCSLVGFVLFGIVLWIPLFGLLICFAGVSLGLGSAALWLWQERAIAEHGKRMTVGRQASL